MVSIKRQFNKGYILMESLLVLSLLTIITTLMLSEVTNSQKSSQALNQQIEILNVSKMALDGNLSALTANGVSVNIFQNNQSLIISDVEGKESLHLEILEIQK